MQVGPVGERLVLDCYNPLVLGEQPRRRPSNPLPKIAPPVVAACKESLTKPAPPLAGSAPLVPRDGGRTVYDAHLGVTWLADANLPAMETFGVDDINKSGTMSYTTALRWVAAMNAASYLGHNNWQLPTAPDTDRTCQVTGRHGESFGYGCTASALGSLYSISLGLHEPDSALPAAQNQAGRFRNFQPYLYWSKSEAADPRQGFITFSFGNGFQGANVERNSIYVLPMIKGKLPGTPDPPDTRLQLNPDGATVYDPAANITWLADANLPARQTFGLTAINRDGSMDHDTAPRWVDALNHARYLGRTGWDLPETGPPDATCSMKGTTGYGCTGSALGSLFYGGLGLHPGDSVVPTSTAHVGPFVNLQPYLYWACSGPTATSPCQPNGPADNFEWNFSFGNGFQGTNLVGNDLFVMVYYPETSAQSAPKP
jgi:hypothetical protein